MRSIVSSKLGRRLALAGTSAALVFAVIAAIAIRNTTPSRLGVAIGVMALVTATAISLFLLTHRLVLRPIQHLIDSLARIEHGDFFSRARVDSKDEIGELATAMNRVLAKITDLRAESIDAEREMEEVKGELQLKQKIAQQSLAIETANRRLSQRLSQLTFLYNLGHELASQLHVESLLDRISTLVHEELHVPRFAVLLFDESRGHTRVEAWRGFSTSRIEAERALETKGTISGEAIETRHSVYVPDLAADQRALIFEDDEQRSGTVQVVPVIYQKRLLGLLHFASKDTDAFSEEERGLFEALGNQAALALANAQLFDRAVELSLTDPLTGIPNRRALQQRLDQEWASARRYDHPLSLLMVDIDFFKSYNDQHGHLQGDDVLRRVSHILRHNVRRSDALGRFGGEEFLIILPQTNKEQALSVAQKLRRSVEQADFPGGYLQPLGRVTISCGVATSKDDAENLGALLRAADDAVLIAKERGRNQVVDHHSLGIADRASQSPNRIDHASVPHAADLDDPTRP